MIQFDREGRGSLIGPLLHIIPFIQCEEIEKMNDEIVKRTPAKASALSNCYGIKA